MAPPNTAPPDTAPPKIATPNIALRNATPLQSNSHAPLAVYVRSDVDGRVRGPDGETHVVANSTYYTFLSTWDTYRAWGPLMCKLQPQVPCCPVKKNTPARCEFSLTTSLNFMPVRSCLHPCASFLHYVPNR